MTKRTWTFTALCAVGALLLLGTGAQMAEIMTLKAEGGQATAVTFKHQAHAMERGLPCTSCHHNMAEVGTPACASCHKLVQEGEARALEQAYHDQCIGCHKSPPPGKTPPTECEQCHPKSASSAT